MICYEPSADGRRALLEARPRRARIAAGITGDPVGETGRGFRMVTAGSDVGFLKAGLIAARTARDALHTTEGHTTEGDA